MNQMQSFFNIYRWDILLLLCCLIITGPYCAAEGNIPDSLLQVFQEDRISSESLAFIYGHGDDIIRWNAKEALPYINKVFEEAKRRKDYHYIVKISTQIAWAYDLMEEHDKHYLAIQNTLLLAKKHGEIRLENFMYDRLAYCFLKQQAFDRADSLLRVKLATETLSKEVRGKMLQTLGEKFFHQGSYDSAIYYIQQGQPYLLMDSDSAAVAEGHRKLGITFRQKGNLDESAHNFLQALHYYRALNTPSAEAMILNNLGFLYHRKEQEEKALEFCEQALERWAVSKNDIRALAGIHNNIGNIAKALGNYDKAVVNLRLGFQLTVNQAGSEKLSNQATGAMNLALLFMDGLQKYDSAAHYLALAKEAIDQTSNKYKLCIYWINFGELARLQEQYKLALQRYAKADELCWENEYLTLIKALLKFQALAYQGLGDIDSAMLKMEERADLVDSLSNEQNKNNVAKIEAQLKNYQIQDDLKMTQFKADAAKKEKDLWQKYALIVGVLLLLSLVLAAGLYNSQLVKKRLNNKIVKTNEELKEKNGYIKTLHSDLQHRFKNNLNLLNSMVAMQADKLELPEAQAVLTATMTRIEALVLLHRMLDKDPSNSEINIPMDEYLLSLIHQLKSVVGTSSNVIKLDTQIAPISLAVDQALSVALILNEWLTNAFKHAVPKNESPLIKVSFGSIGNGNLELIVSDNGPGFDPDQRRKNAYGIDLVESQIRQLRGELDLDVSSGTWYTLTFPKRQTHE